jgi:methyl-coenzyme M reductase subunit D
VELDKFNDFMNQLEDILTETLSVEYSLLVGIFTRTTSTISDYLKYGIGFENLIDKRYIGLIDSRARSSESISIIK